MNKRLAIALSCVLLGGVTVFAQPMPKNGPKVLVKKSRFFMAPQWSPDGKSITFTSEKFNGLWIIDSSGKDMKQISTDGGAGYGYSWNEEGNCLLIRPNKYENNRKLNAVKIIDLKTSETTTIEEYSAEIKGIPLWKDRGATIQVKKQNQLYQTKSGLRQSKSTKTLKQTNQDVYEIILNNPTKCSELIPSFSSFRDRIIFNAKQSPDGSKIVFQAGGKGLYVCQSDGTDVKQIGMGENPAWMPDSKYIIVSRIKDNGHTITDGELLSVNTDNGIYTPFFSNPSIIASRPSVSPDGSNVAFNDPEKGIIYVLAIQK